MFWFMALFAYFFTFPLTYAASNARDRAAETFQKEMDNLERNERNGRSNDLLKKTKLKNDPFSNRERSPVPEDYQKNKGQLDDNKRPCRGEFDKDIKKLSQNMEKILLKLNFLEKKLNTRDKKTPQFPHKTQKNQKKLHKKKKVTEILTQKKNQKSKN